MQTTTARISASSWPGHLTPVRTEPALADLSDVVTVALDLHCVPDVQGLLLDLEQLAARWVLQDQRVLRRIASEYWHLGRRECLSSACGASPHAGDSRTQTRVVGVVTSVDERWPRRRDRQRRVLSRSVAPTADLACEDRSTPRSATGSAVQRSSRERVVSRTRDADLIGHPGVCLDRRRGGPRDLAPCGGPKADWPLPGVVRCRQAATGRSPVEGLVFEVPQRYLVVGAL